MQIMINSLNQMPLSGNKINGSSGISILMANSMMFQSYPSHKGYEDPQLSNFYGQALPLLKRGVPVKTLHLENVAYPKTWEGTKVLIMSYAHMKPLNPEAHTYIADWVKNGGTLIYCGNDNDPFQTVQEWWNTGSNSYNAPSEHLFRLLGLKDTPGEGEYTCEKGLVYVMREDPKAFVLKAGNDERFITTIKHLYEQDKTNSILEFKNYFYLERGPFTLVAVLDESITNEPYILNGLFIDLFNPQLSILKKKKIDVGEQAYLYDLNKIATDKPQVLATAARIYNEAFGNKNYSFVAKSPVNTTNVMRVLLPAAPKKSIIKNTKGDILAETTCSWDETSKTCLISFENDPEGITVSLEW